MVHIIDEIRRITDELEKYETRLSEYSDILDSGTLDEESTQLVRRKMSGIMAVMHSLGQQLDNAEADFYDIMG